MICNRCGIDEDSVRMEKRRDRCIELLCRSCVAKPAKTITGPFGKCIPWHEAFDDDDNPLDEFGEFYLPGPRICGKRDCVNRDHVEVK